MLRTLRPLPTPVGTAVLDVWWRPLAAALDGTGPALVPVPDGVDGERVLAMARLDQPVEDPVDDPVALVVPTSGSTGPVKGALLGAGALRHSAGATHERLGGPGHWLLALPVTHIAGLQVLIRSLLAGHLPVCLDTTGGFTPDRFAAATAQLPGPPRYTSLVPTQAHRLLTGPAAGRRALAAYDAVLLGGAAADTALLARATDAGVRIVTTYGMTETCGGCVYDGTALRDVRVGFDPTGRVELGGPVVFAGYRLRPDLTAPARRVRDGLAWHVTGDLGELRADGTLRILGRVDDMIVTGGEKIAPMRVEDALVGLPEVRAAAVIGVPDPEWGQRVAAVVVPEEPGDPPTLDRLRAALADRLPAAGLPRTVTVVERLPLLGSGKVDRAALRRLVGGDTGPRMR